MGGNLLKYRISDYFNIGCSDGLVARGISLRKIRDFREFDIGSLKIQIDTPIGAYPRDISIRAVTISSSSTGLLDMIHSR
ncbi:MAG: hypothetical protein ACI807_001165 [Paracoccaceae bacterium]|jgi:hypothetical protein